MKLYFGQNQRQMKSTIHYPGLSSETYWALNVHSTTSYILRTFFQTYNFECTTSNVQLRTFFQTYIQHFYETFFLVKFSLNIEKRTFSLQKSSSTFNQFHLMERQIILTMLISLNNNPSYLNPLKTIYINATKTLVK